MRGLMRSVGLQEHVRLVFGAVGCCDLVAVVALARGVVGDPRASSQNDLTAEFLGDYVYAAATRTGAVGV